MKSKLFAPAFDFPFHMEGPQLLAFCTSLVLVTFRACGTFFLDHFVGVLIISKPDFYRQNMCKLTVIGWGQGHTHTQKIPQRTWDTTISRSMLPVMSEAAFFFFTAAFCCGFNLTLERTTDLVMFSFSNDLFWGQWTIPLLCKKQETLLVKPEDTCFTKSDGRSAQILSRQLGPWFSCQSTSKPLSIGWLGELHVNFGSRCEEFECVVDFGSLTFQLCLF